MNFINPNLLFLKWNSGHLINLGWSNNEEILCCQDNGLVLIYDLFGNYQHTFSMIKVGILLFQSILQYLTWFLLL